MSKVQIAKLNELTESEVSELICTTVDDATLVILTREGSRGIAIVSFQK
jgi:hypothetical protein